MTKKAHPSDWDRLFNSNAPRRRGPIGLFIIMSITLTLIAGLLVGARFGVQKYDERQAELALTSTPLWADYYATQTATALADQATPVPTATNTPTQTVRVIAAGNLRSEPRIAADTIVGQVAIGQTASIVEQRAVDGSDWYRVELKATDGTSVGSGWVNSTLLEIAATP